jgi:hypothetical protein
MPAPQTSQLSQLIRVSYQSTAPGGFVKGPPQMPGLAPRGATAINYDAYIDKISAAVCTAWSQWQGMATLVGVIINGVTAVGGQVIGPPWTPLILAQGLSPNAEESKMTNVIASVLGTAWLSFTSTIKVTGMPWYPAFAAVPSPVAPPTPNIPCPVAALTMVPIALASDRLAMQMVATDGSNSSDHKRLYTALADGFEKVFNLWKVATMVTNVLGTGPVPTFAPPYVPVGPVVGGIGTMTPGGFS